MLISWLCFAAIAGWPFLLAVGIWLVDSPVEARATAGKYLSVAVTAAFLAVASYAIITGPPFPFDI